MRVWIRILLLCLCLGVVTPEVWATPQPTETSPQRKKKKKKTSTTTRRKKTTTTKKSTSPKPRQQEPRTRQSVSRDKAKTQEEIRRTETKINTNKRTIDQKMRQLSTLNAQIDRQTRLINGITDTIRGLDRQITSLTDTITTTEGQIQRLKADYARSLREARVRRSGVSDFELIFSGRSMAQSLRRLRYLQQLSQQQRDRALALQEATQRLNGRRSDLQGLHASKAQAAGHLAQAKTRLEQQQQQTNRLVRRLKDDNASLADYLKRKQQMARQLDRELDKIVAEELERQRRAEEAERRRLAAEANARANAANGAPSSEAKPQPTPTPEPRPEAKPKPEPRPSAYAEANRKLTGSFEANKGRLLFPVSGKYRLVGSFGISRHPDLPKVEISNAGIDVEVNAGTNARSVYEGVVSMVFQPRGYPYVVVVRHGDYLTVYGGLDRINVRKGDKVKTGQTLGHIFTDTADDNRTTLHFEVRHLRDKLNPLDWVR